MDARALLDTHALNCPECKGGIGRLLESPNIVQLRGVEGFPIDELIGVLTSRYLCSVAQGLSAQTLGLTLDAWHRRSEELVAQVQGYADKAASRRTH